MQDRPIDAPARVGLITGASSGIGAALARRLARPGASLLLHARKSRTALEAVAAEARDAGAKVKISLGDLARKGVAEALIDETTGHFGGLDVVVANAGFPIAKTFDEVTDVDLDYALAGNTMSFLALARAARAWLSRSEAGRLIAVGSFTAHVFRPGMPQFPASVISKGALETAVRSLALTFASDGITVNCVVPGYIAKDAGIQGSISREKLVEIVKQIPLARLGRPDEVAAMIAFLASEDAAYTTGQIIHVNGGLC